MVAHSNTKTNSGWRLFAQTVIGRAYPRVIGTQRDLSWLFFDIFMPFMSMIGYVFVYRALQAPEDYIGFVVMGGAMTAFWINILWSMSSQLYWEKETGNLGLYIMAPTSLMAILLGMASGGVVATTIRALVILLVGSWIFDVAYVIGSFWLLFAVFTLTMIALYGMGMMLASIFLLLNREAWHLSSLAQEPIFLLSGFYFPVNAFNFWVALGASIIPLTLGMDAIRQLVFQTGVSLGFLSVKLEVAILGLLSVLFVIAAYFMLKKMEQLAIREGSLTDRLN